VTGGPRHVPWRIAHGLCCLATAVLACAASAGEPAASPILRIDTAMHSALVRRIVVDPRGNRLVSAGDDKTIRVWQLPQGRLERVMRVPIGAGYEGRLYALAITPDGRHVAAGGWTGWEWDRQGAVYVFDVDSGALVRRIGGFPDVIGSLAYSRDGRHLAVGLQADAGLRILRTTDYATVAQDLEYRDKILGADFGAGGLLAVTSLDGQLRLYDRDFALLGRKRVAPGAKPLTVRFSPDGRLLAVSFHDVAAVAVYAASDLSLAFTPDTERLARHTRLTEVAWSSDGLTLYSCGDYSGAGPSPVLRWRAAGRGPMEAMPATRHRVADLQPLPGGGVAFAAEDPAIGILDAPARPGFFRGPELAEFPASDPAFKVSRDGARVQFSPAPGKTARFGLFARELLPGAAASDELAEAIVASPRLALADWRDSPAPSLNGVRLALDDYEIARSYAFSPDHAVAVLGTEWALRAYDAGAVLLWRTEVPGLARSVAVTPDGHAVVVAVSDGTIRWYRMADGAEFLALFPHPAAGEWIAWNRQGYYVASNFGDDYVGWHLNRGKDRDADFYRAVQFERVLYRPDLVDDSFRRRGHTDGGTLRRAIGRFDVTQLSSIAPARVRVALADPPAPAPEGGLRARLRISAEQGAAPMLEQAVFVNGIPVTPAPARALAGGDRQRFVREAAVSLVPGANRVRVEVSSGTSLGVAETYVDADAAPARPAPAGDLYVLAVGVNVFPGLPGAALAYAARDAEELARFFREAAPRHFRRVFVRTVSDLGDAPPERANILAALDFATGAGEHDTVVLFLASHGVSDASGDYFFVPRDARAADVAAVVHGGASDAPSLIRWSTLADALRRVAGRRILILDTCHARNAEGRIDVQSLGKRSAASRIGLLVASKGDEESQEYAPARHGLFTHALLDGLRGAADGDGDGVVTLEEAFRFAQPVVDRLRDRAIGPQTPQLIAPESLGATVLARRGAR
jgi:WD40 repeat protein